MADYYTQFSFVIDCDKNQYDWLRKAINDEDPEAAGDDLFPCDISFDRDGAWLRDDGGSCDVDSVALALQRFLNQFHLARYYWFEWANTCTRPRLDSFSGGGCLILPDEIVYINPSDEKRHILSEAGIEVTE